MYQIYQTQILTILEPLINDKQVVIILKYYKAT